MTNAIRVRRDLLSRDDLLQRLLAQREVPCVVLCAGAGYGKTTLARQWIAADPRPAAWVDVDESDDDPVILLRKVLRALNEIDPLLDVSSAPAGPVPSSDAMTSALATALGQGQAPFVLVLDDVHLIEARQSAPLLEHLITSVPAGSQLVLCGRSARPIHLPRRLLSGEAFQLDEADLAFTEAEASLVIRNTMSDLDEDAVVALVDWTEGWPAGLQLALLGLRDRSEPGEAVGLWGRGDRRVTEYFREEVLQRMPDSVRWFLIRTSILDRLSGPLCDAVLEESGCGLLLDELASSENLFVVALDPDREWFRYHHMFADLLRAELHRAVPDVELGLRRRAADWLRLHGEGDAAVRQATAAGDLDLAADIVYQNLFTAIDAGHTATLERWLAAFSPQDVRQRATLALTAGWLAVVSGRAGETEHWLEVIEHASDSGPLPDGTTSIAVARAALAMSVGQDGVKQAAVNAGTVRAAGPDGSPWWTLSVLVEAIALYLSGEVQEVVDLFGSAEFALRGSGLLHPIALAYLALAHLERGEPAGQAIAQQAADEIRNGRLEDVAIVSVVHCVHALAAAKRGAREESLSAAEKGSELMEHADPAPRAIIFQGLILAEAAHWRGDDRDATARLAVAEALLPAEPDAMVLHDWVDRLGDQISTHEASQRVLCDLGVTEAELRVLRLLPTHLSLEDIGHHLFISRNTVKSHVVSIYRKLGVSSRSGAVERAQQLDVFHDPTASPTGATS